MGMIQVDSADILKSQEENDTLRARLDSARMLLMEIIRDSEDVQQGMVLEFLGEDIRKWLAEDGEE